MIGYFRSGERLDIPYEGMCVLLIVAEVRQISLLRPLIPLAREDAPAAMRFEAFADPADTSKEVDKAEVAASGPRQR